MWAVGRLAAPEPIQRTLLDEAPRPAVEKRRAGIERRFDVGYGARLALKEKQIQQNVRPVMAVHKWFVRRPERGGGPGRAGARPGTL